MQFSRNQIEILHGKLCGRAAGGIRDIEFGKLVARRLASEEDPLAVRRPAWTLIVESMIGDFGQCSTRRRNHPDVRVLAVVVGLSSPIGNKGDARAVRRPLRIGVVPILAIGDLLGLTTLNIHNPQMPALVVKPSGVIELVLDMRVVPHIALAVRRCDPIGGARSADGNDTASVGRPLITLHAVL